MQSTPVVEQGVLAALRQANRRISSTEEWCLHWSIVLTFAVSATRTANMRMVRISFGLPTFRVDYSRSVFERRFKRELSVTHQQHAG